MKLLGGAVSKDEKKSVEGKELDSVVHFIRVKEVCIDLLCPTQGDC